MQLRRSNSLGAGMIPRFGRPAGRDPYMPDVYRSSWTIQRNKLCGLMVNGVTCRGIDLRWAVLCSALLCFVFLCLACLLCLLPRQTWPVWLHVWLC